MAVHRVEVVGVPDDDDAARIVRPGIHNLTIGNRVNVRAGRVTVLGVPVLAGVPVAREVGLLLIRF